MTLEERALDDVRAEGGAGLPYGLWLHVLRRLEQRGLVALRDGRWVLIDASLSSREGDEAVE